ncbi:MAG: hypothetical protein HOG03_15865 [Desulfobacula sp.]|uniref:hypothetical protein n=1 Tax=Desulfobacula sp. TaxID=2593537 RepID=UPI001D57C4BC|nr:hypothetical protein [Desulfobacula sp.]MBT3487326.1 hypothetical protein [Desulfobacula sp.]MBT3806059.1 hypothetical protein [Desulfobacula sp.]MBT4199069.1 hypothetical protein [Desulfobacula sp.]MBT4507766.1 hypothetical protein [Desulfobacula sp.]
MISLVKKKNTNPFTFKKQSPKSVKKFIALSHDLFNLLHGAKKNRSFDQTSICSIRILF